MTAIVEIISATRLSEETFWETSALGQSLRRLKREPRIEAHITFDNGRGLPDIFNERINVDRHDGDGADGGHLIFMHDDVWIDDFFLIDRVIEACKTFDVVGVAGNTRRLPRQPGWCIVDAKTLDDSRYFSGSVAHGPSPFGYVNHFGPTPAACELLDGLFLAARRSVLRGHGVQFYPAFDFHFYDLDFCRTAKEKGLRLGTWPIALTHQSNPLYGNPEWSELFLQYCEKWEPLY